MDEALDRHGTRRRFIALRQRALQQWLQRGLETIYCIYIEHSVERLTGPLYRRARLNIEPLVYHILECEEVATLLDGIVAIHLEDIGLRVDTQVEQALASALDDISYGRVDNELHLGIRLHIEGHRNIHRATTRSATLLPILKEDLLAHEVRCRVHALRCEGYKVGTLDVALVGQRHKELRVVVTACHKVHLYTRLVTSYRACARGKYGTVEHRVVVLGGVEHLHIIHPQAYIILDVRQVFEREVYRE